MPHLIATLLAAAVVAAPEYKKAEGTWQVVGMEMNGVEMPAAAFKDLRMVLKGNTVRALSGKDVIAEGRYRVVAVKGKRVEFDLHMSAGPDQGKTLPAVNEWADADTIRTCVVQPGDPRPAKLTPGEGERAAVFVIKRTKK
ncbi:MAG TPA: TIGR03067 domain-containing protein [Fimbriiglobus sp.]|jgi:uncharacterized protein (TIGR03067 family)|nr:TIGR03067 domain-containing protein [Fimbriiglobus sp.]